MTVRAADAPLHSAESLAADLGRLGLAAGDAVLVHSSLKRIGPVVGGPVAVLLALESVLGEDGTLVMPTFSEHLCDPADRQSTEPPQVQAHQRAHMPLYDPDLTPVDRGNGFLTEVFRKQSGTLRSEHPHVSFAARGQRAQEIVANHPLSDPLGPASPLGSLYGLRARTLLLGVGGDALTALHLAEYSVPRLRRNRRSWQVRVAVDGQPTWLQYRDVPNDSDVFPDLLRDYLAQDGTHARGRVGDAESLLLPVVELVDFGVTWLSAR